MGFVPSLLLALAAPSPDQVRAATHAAACEVGAAAIADLPVVVNANPNPKLPLFYSDRATSALNLVQVCPELRNALPKTLPLAGAAEFANLAEPTSTHPIGMIDIAQPTVNPDLQSATVDIDYRCNGMCGIRWRLTYRRNGAGWRLAGEPVVIGVS